MTVVDRTEEQPTAADLELHEASISLVENTNGSVVADDGTITIHVIRPTVGRGRGNHLYEAAMLKEHAHIFGEHTRPDGTEAKGWKMYVNHLSAKGRAALGGLPRSVQDLGGRIVESWWDDSVPANGRFEQGAVVAKAKPTPFMRELSDITFTTCVFDAANFAAKPVGQNSITDAYGNTLTIPLNMRSGDGRVELRSVTGGSTVFFDPCGKPPVCQQTFTQDITCTSPDKLYVQGDSGASANVKVGTFPTGAPYIRQWEQAGASTVAFKKPATPGNRLLATVSSTSDAPAWVTPAGWTEIENSLPSFGCRLYEKIADGTETAFTTTTTGGAIAVAYVELADIGNATYLTGKNSGNTLTSIAPASSPPSAVKTSYGIALIACNASLGASGAITDGFGEIRSNATPVYHRLIGKLITTPGAVNPTYNWATPRNTAALLAVAEQNIETFKPQVMVI